MHHFNSTAGKSECHRPKGGLAGPVCDLVDCCSKKAPGQHFFMAKEDTAGIDQRYVVSHNLQSILHNALWLFLTRKGDFAPRFAGDAEWWTILRRLQ